MVHFNKTYDMKNFKIIFLLLGVIYLTASCESDEEKYSGTPVGNLELITLTGEVRTNVTAALTNQKIPFEVDLLGKTFADTVTVEATTLNLGGGRTRVSVDVMPGETTATGEIPAAGGAIFNTTMELFLSGIALKTTEPGKHYLLKSNVVSINTGSTTVPTDDNSRLQIRFAWFNPSVTRNNLKVFVDRPNAASYQGSVTSASGTTVFVSDTSGLQAGMAVAVSSGAGAFPNNTVVTSVGANSFTVSQAPTAANALGATTVVTAGGNDYTAQATGPNATTTINVASTAGLYPGMVVSVTGGAGAFRPGSTVTSITSLTQFKVLQAPSTALNATSVITAAYPDIYPSFSGGTISHDIINANGPVSAGTSSPQGVYYFKFLPTNLLESGADLPFRILWKQPDGTVGFYDGVYQAATLGSASKTILKVTKTGIGSAATYAIETAGF
jgi:hypothetical protein